MVVTIDCRDAINCKVTIVLCNSWALIYMNFRLQIAPERHVRGVYCESFRTQNLSL